MAVGATRAAVVFTVWFVETTMKRRRQTRAAIETRKRLCEIRKGNVYNQCFDTHNEHLNNNYSRFN